LTAPKTMFDTKIAIGRCLRDLSPERATCKPINVHMYTDTRIIVEFAGSAECNGIYTANPRLVVNGTVFFENTEGKKRIVWLRASKAHPARWSITCSKNYDEHYFVECTETSSIPPNNWYTYVDMAFFTCKPGFTPMPRLRIATAEEGIESKRLVEIASAPALEEDAEWQKVRS